MSKQTSIVIDGGIPLYPPPPFTSNALSMSSSPPSAPRRSARERKQVEVFGSDPNTVKKRKRVSDARSDDGELPQEDEIDEGLEEDGKSASGSDEDKEEDYAAPRKSMSQKSKKLSASTGDGREAAANGRGAARKARGGMAPREPPKRRGGRKKAGAEDIDPKALAKEAAIADDNALFNAILNPSAALQSTAEDFLDSYERSPGAALADLVNCVLRACGCNASVDSDRVLDSDGIIDCLDDLMEDIKKDASPTYPLASKLPVFKKFRKSLSELLYRIVISAAETGALYNEEFIPTLQGWVIAMSSAQVRSFRHTATVVALEVESAIAEVAGGVDKEASVLRRQKEGEKKKKGATSTANAKGKGREQELQIKFDEVQNRRSQLREFLKEFFDGLFVLRYRDADATIRAECVQEFGVWLEKYPAFFLEGSHLRYVGWVLSDASTQVRIAAVKALKPLYKRGEYPTSINHFTQRFKPRLVNMATSDSDIAVRVAVIDVLCTIDVLGELEEDQTDKLELLIFDHEARVRKAVSGFVHNVWKTAVDERMTKRRAGHSGSQEVDSDRTKVGFKCLAALLVKWAKSLEKAEGVDTSEQAESQEEGGSDVGGVGYKGKEVTALVSDTQRGRIALCVDSLWDDIEALGDWEGLVDYLLLDHSAKGDDDASLNPVASKRKKAAESSARGRKRKSKAADADGEADELWRLDDTEEAVMMEVLVACLKKHIGDVSSDKKKGEGDVFQAEMTRVLMKALPRLFAKHQADERRIAEVLLIPQLMSLDMYTDMGMNKAYESLWDDVSKHFLSHSSPTIIRNAAVTISYLLSTAALFQENSAKIVELEEELSTTLRDVISGRDDMDAAFLEDDEVQALSSLTLRVESLFRVRDMSAWMEEDADGKQSSAWTIFMSLAARSSRGTKEEEMMVDHTFQSLTLHIAWKVRHLSGDDANAEEEVPLRKTIEEERDQLAETLDACAFGETSRAEDGVRRSAFQCLLLLHTLFLPKQGDAEGKPYAAASIPMEMPEKMQYRVDGFMEAELERYADDLAEQNEDANDGGEEEGTVRGSSDEEEEESRTKTKGKKKQKAALKAKKAKAPSTSRLPQQTRLEREYMFISVIVSLLSALKAGVVNIRHASKPLAYYGRLGTSYDQCMKVIIELLREEGMYKSNGLVVAEVIKDAIKDSFTLYLDGRAPNEEHSVALAKALSSSALLVRGSQLAIIRRLEGEYVVDIHNSLVSWIVKKIAQYEKNGNKLSRNSSLEFFKVLTPMLLSITKADAAAIQTHLTDALAAVKIEVSPSAKAWDPLRTYEKRLVAATLKGKAKAPIKGRKSKASAADDATSDDEPHPQDPITDGDNPVSPPHPQSPRRNTRSAMKMYGGAALQQEQNPTPTIAKSRPRPKPKTKTTVEDTVTSGRSAAPALPVNGFGHYTPEASPIESSPRAGPSQSNGAHSPARSSANGKRKRDEDEIEDEIEQDENGPSESGGIEEDEDQEDEQGSPNLLKFKKHPRPPSSQISHMSQLDIDFFKTRKRVRR
ncbi:hypothetical protein FRB93_005518 [Tulasnella sp. JGI-2019a]|nr:hypothetical protein FRB93_005518 [Tulasnella sp. JGI-2019a]